MVMHDVVDDLDVFDPLAIGALPGQPVLHFHVVVEAALLQVDDDHLAGAEPALFDDPLFGQAHHAGLRSGEQQIVLGDGIAHRPEAVTVHAGERPASVIGADRRRAVPGLHHRVGIAVEVLVRLGHRRILRPGLGNEHGLHHGQLPAGADH
jgi:hypothetical protein